MNASDRDALLGRLDERTEITLEIVKEQNGRIGALERWQARILGGVGVAAVVVPIVAIKGDAILGLFKGG